MNERILELNAQADKYAWEKVGKKYDSAGDLNWQWEDNKMEKFAELIVRECVQTLIDNTPERYTNESAEEEDWDKGYVRAMRYCVHHIQEHFGVEE